MAIEGIIMFLLRNFTLTLFIVGFSAGALARASKTLDGSTIAEALFKRFLFFSIGVAYICNAIFHVIFHETAAGYIGWVDSPFQIRNHTAPSIRNCASETAEFRAVIGVRLGLELVASGRKLSKFTLRLSDGKYFSGALSHHHWGLRG